MTRVLTTGSSCLGNVYVVGRCSAQSEQARSEQRLDADACRICLRVDDFFLFDLQVIYVWNFLIWLQWGQTTGSVLLSAKKHPTHEISKQG